MRILLVEDSQRLQSSLSQGLAQEGFAVDQAWTGTEALEFATTYEYDVIILDLMLPEIDGFTVLKQLRRLGKTAHILILSARYDVQDRIHGLELGADDYLTKPFNFAELVARLRALIRRSYQIKNPEVTIGPYCIDFTLRQIKRDDLVLDLSPKEFAILEFLVLRRGRPISRQMLTEHIYDSASDIGSNVIDVLIYNIRKKLQGSEGPALIQTRRGFGYVVP